MVTRNKWAHDICARKYSTTTQSGKTFFFGGTLVEDEHLAQNLMNMFDNLSIFDPPEPTVCCELCGQEFTENFVKENDYMHIVLGHLVCQDCFGPRFEKMKEQIVEDIKANGLEEE